MKYNFLLLIKKLHLLIIIISIFVFASCEKEVNIPLPEFIPKPVVYGFISENDSIKIMLTQTHTMYEVAYNINPLEADVNLYVNNNFIEKLTLIDSLYFAKNYLPKTNDKVQLQIITKSGENISATTYIPIKVKIDSLSYKKNAITNNEGIFSKFDLTFKDQPTKDFYEIKVEVIDTIGVFFNYFIYIDNSSSPIILNEDNSDNGCFLLFSDQLFNGNNVTINFNIKSNQIFESDIIVVHLYHITEDYYKFKKQLYKQQTMEPTSIIGDQTLPYNVYSNITGGYGVFSGYSMATDTIY